MRKTETTTSRGYTSWSLVVPLLVGANNHHSDHLPALVARNASGQMDHVFKGRKQFFHMTCQTRDGKPIVKPDNGKTQAAEGRGFIDNPHRAITERRHQATQPTGRPHRL